MSWYDDLKEGMKEKKEEKAQLREVEQNAYKEAALERKHEKAAERVERAREKGYPPYLEARSFLNIYGYLLFPISLPATLLS